jgi:hypothetical protein
MFLEAPKILGKKFFFLVRTEERGRKKKAM